MKYVRFVDSPIEKFKKILQFDYNVLPLKSTKGSFAVLGARLMGLSWPDYLRMCRDVFGAEIIGKHSMYPVIYFTEDKLTHEFESLLNIRIETMLKNREMPDLLEKVEELRKQKAERNYEKKENS